MNIEIGEEEEVATVVVAASEGRGGNEGFLLGNDKNGPLDGGEGFCGADSVGGVGEGAVIGDWREKKKKKN